MIKHLSSIVMIIILLIGCTTTQPGQTTSSQPKPADYGFPWKFADLSTDEMKTAIKLGYASTDMVYRNAPMGKIIPAKNQPKVIVKKMTIIDNEIVYYGVINLKVTHAIDVEEIEKQGFKVPDVWVEIRDKGRSVKYMAKSQVP